MESIVQLRQMMADQKFQEVQRLVEVKLQTTVEDRHGLLLLFHEALLAREKQLPSELALELAERELELKNYEFVTSLLDKIKEDEYFAHRQKILSFMAQERGQIDQLYELLSEFYVRQFEKQVPFIPDWVSISIARFFKHDFNLRLKGVAIDLMLKNYESVERQIRELIISMIERSSSRGLKEKLKSIREVLLPYCQNNCLYIYEKLCYIWLEGIQEKKDYKRFVEMILYFDDFKFQAIILHLLHHFERTEVAKDYAETVRASRGYTFVHFDKYFPELKHYFVSKQNVTPREIQEVPALDLGVKEKISSSSLPEESAVESLENEQLVISILKHNDYGFNELCDLAVGFLQAEMYRAALKSSTLAEERSSEAREFLKAAYLKLHCELLLKDYRGAIDTALVALSKSSSREDVLSFLYVQAEAYIRLGQIKEAKLILSRVISIDAGYRLAKERLEKL